MYTTTTVAFGPSFPVMNNNVLTILVPWTPQFGAAYQQFLNSGYASGPIAMPYGGGSPFGGFGGVGGFPSGGLGGYGGGFPSGGFGGFGGGLPGTPFGFGVTTS